MTDGAQNLPAPRDGDIPGHWKSSWRGSIAGPPIWVMEEAYIPSTCTCQQDGRKHCLRHAGADRFSELMAKRGGENGRWLPHDGADVDGFAVFGRFPRGWLDEIVRLRLLGDVRRDEILHVCSGTLGPVEKWTIDVRVEARPRVVADGAALPFHDSCFRAVLCDPPYSEQYARNLYGTKNPRPSWLLKEAARVVKPGGHIGMLHVAVPFAPPACRLVRVFGVSTGVGFRMRAFTVYERSAQTELLDADHAQRTAGRR